MNICHHTFRHSMFSCVCSLLAMLLCTTTTNAETQFSTGTDEQAQLPYWEMRDGYMMLRLVQRLPDQTRGFFTARGFSAAHTEIVAQSCVFQAVFKNESSQGTSSPLEYDLREWVVSVAGATHGIKTREEWKAQWQREGVARPAQLAFEWAIYPTRQMYQSGDYNWGMATFNLKPGTVFDLKVVWRQHGSVHAETIHGIQCAQDIAVNPAVTQ